MRRFCRLVAPLLALCAVARRAQAADRDLAEAVGRFDMLRVGGASAVPRDARLAFGHLSLALASGRAAPVFAGSELVGIFFEGRGALEYRSSDPVEFPVVAYNARKASGPSVDRGEKTLTLRDRIEHVLWLSAGLPPQDLVVAVAAAGTARAGGAQDSLERSFGLLREKFRRARGGPTSHLLAAQLWNGPASTLVAAEIDGGSSDLRYFYDGVETLTERLELLYKPATNDPEIRKQLFRVTLSEVPIGRERGEAGPPPFDLKDVRLDLMASDGKDVSLTVTETVASRRPIAALRFGLFNTTYAIGGVGQAHPRTCKVARVLDAEGRALSFHHQGDEILVGLPAPAPPGAPMVLVFEISGDFLIRPRGDSFWRLGMDEWFPQPEWSGQAYTFHAKVRVKRPFVPFAAGRTLVRRTEGEDAVVETEMTDPMQFAVVLAGRYEIEEETRDGLTVRVASYAGRNTRAMKQLADLTFRIVRYYESVLGPFPLSELQILEINEYGFGQGPPGILFITREAFSPLMGETNRMFSQGVNERFAHEIAHQYWGHAVRMASEEEQWLSESFAEYCAALFLKHAKGEGLLPESISTSYSRLLAHWKRGAEDAGDACPIPLANRVAYPGDPYAAALIRTGLLYDKGALLLATLNGQLGDETFFAALKAYQESFRWKYGSTKSFQSLLERLTRNDYAEFFRRYYWGTQTPPS